MKEIEYQQKYVRHKNSKTAGAGTCFTQAISMT